MALTQLSLDREEAKKEDNFDFSNEYDEEEEEEWEGDNDWNNDADEAEDVKDESAAYLEFLNEEVPVIMQNEFAATNFD